MTLAVKLLVLAGACTAALVATAPVRAADDPFYKGKRLTLLVGSAPGGPTDVEGRLVAKYIGKHIDGQPTVTVQNRDGGGGLLGPTYLGEVAPRDGTMLGYFSASAWIYVNTPEHWRVDFKTYEFVAYQPGTTIVFMRTDVPPGMKVPADIVKAKGLVVAGLAVDNPRDLKLRLALDLLGVPFKYVPGYRTSTPARLAVQRGEAHIMSELPPGYRSGVHPVLVRSGEMMPVWYEATDTRPGAPAPKSIEGLAIPSFPQLYASIKGSAPSGPLWEAFRTIFEVNSTLQRIATLPPGVPKAASDALRLAMQRLNRDPDFAAEAIRTMEFAPEYEADANVAPRVRGLLVASPEVRAFVADYIKNANR